MKILHGLQRAAPASGCALTIGNFDGVHRGHQAMLTLLREQAARRGLPSCVLTFEPHPRDYFAALHQQPALAPARISTLRDKLSALAALGIAQTVILPFNAALAALSAQQFVQQVLVQGLGARYMLAGDDFRFGAQRQGDYGQLARLGAAHGFEVADMQSYAMQDLRVSSTAVRQALHAGDMEAAARLLGRPYAISGHVVHGRKLGRELGCPTLNLRFSHWKPAASGTFVVQVHGLTGGAAAGLAGAALGQAAPLQGVANLGIRPSIDPHDINGGRVLLETHCLQWPAALGSNGGYGKIVRVELLHKLHDERKYTSLAALQQGIAQDCADARAWFASQPEAGQQSASHRSASTRRQTTRDRI